MQDFNISNLDDETVQTIRARAELTGLSIQQVAKHALKLGLLVDGPGRAAIADKVRLMTSPLQENSVDIIRRLRDAT